MRPYWDYQFAEDGHERRERWRAIKAKRKAEGKCWQCAKPIAECVSRNLRSIHPQRSNP